MVNSKMRSPPPPSLSPSSFLPSFRPVAQVFNAMAAIHADGGFECSIQLRLIGQVTFRHGNPAEVVQRACNQPWYYSNMPACSSVDSVCDLPRGADVTCLNQPSGCGAGDLDSCRATCGTSWRTCGNRRRTEVHQCAYSNGECALNSESADEIDEGTFLNTFGNWLTANRAALESAFGNHLDDALAFSGMDFAGSTVSRAGQGTMCRSTSTPSNFVNEIVSASAFRIALSTSQ